MGSIKTTTLGIFGILGALISAASDLLTGHQPNWALIYTGIINGVGLIAAKDHKPVGGGLGTGILMIVMIVLLAVTLAPALHGQAAVLSAVSPMYSGDRIFSTALTANYLGHVADLATTREALADGAVERNPFLRPLYARAPGAAEAASLGIVAAQTWAMKRLYQRCGTAGFCRGLVRGATFASAAFGFYLAAHNHHVSTEIRNARRR